MTWANITCSEKGCYETVTVGHYGIGDYEDEYADYEIIATCGDCNRAKQGLPSRYEEEQAEKAEQAELFANFKNRVKNEGIENVIDYSVTDSNMGSFIEMLVGMWNKHNNHPRRLDAIWNILKTLPNNGLKVVAE